MAAEGYPDCPKCGAETVEGSRNRLNPRSVEYRCSNGCGYIAVPDPGVAHDNQREALNG